METEDFQEIVGFRDKIWLMWKKLLLLQVISAQLFYIDNNTFTL